MYLDMLVSSYPNVPDLIIVMHAISITIFKKGMEQYKPGGAYNFTVYCLKFYTGKAIDIERHIRADIALAKNTAV